MTNDAKPIVTETLPARRRWFRFSMRTILVFITLAACFFGWIKIEQRQSEFERLVGSKHPRPSCKVATVGLYDSPEFIDGKEKNSWWRDLAGRTLGSRILLLQCSCGRANLTQFSRLTNLKFLSLSGDSLSDVGPLAGLNNLEMLILRDTSINDLTPLAGLTNLKKLSLTGDSIKDLAPLGELKNLKFLSLSGDSLSDLTPLAGLKNLKELMLKETSISVEQVKSLEQALPNCRIQ